MFAPLLASIRAISWEVETIKAPVETNINEEIHMSDTHSLQLCRKIHKYPITEGFETLIVEHHQCPGAYQQQEYRDFPRLPLLSSSQEHSLPDTEKKR
jgi:hypothetical protein